MSGRGWAVNGSQRTCTVCGRNAALMHGADGLDFCRWARTGKCTLTLAEAARRRLALLGDTVPEWRRRDLEALAAS